MLFLPPATLVSISSYSFFLCSVGIGDHHKKNSRINSVWCPGGKMPRAELLLASQGSNGESCV